VRPSLDLFIEVETAGGARYRWDANQAPGSRPTNLSWRTSLGNGFGDASLILARRIDFDYSDLNLVDTVTVVGADGSVAYEGRLQAQPLSLDEKHSIGVTLAGWMAHAKDKKFREIYVDRDLGAWGGMSAKRRADLLVANYSPVDGQQQADPSNNEAVLLTMVQDSWTTPLLPLAEIWYDAGPTARIGKVTYSWTRDPTVDNADTSWSWGVFAAVDAASTGVEGTGNLRAAGPVTGSTLTPAGVQHRYALLQLLYTTTASGAAGKQYGIRWSKLAVYGRHGLPTPTGQPGEPGGVNASDVIRHIAGQHCPELDTSGVQDTSYVIQHLAFKDRTYPFDAFLEVNKFHQWHLGVWENKTLHFRPYDLTDYTWEVRTDDKGTTFDAQGPTTEDTYNGVVVTYKDLLTGIENELTPDTHPELADTDPENPWNQHGQKHWKEDVNLSTPALEADAVQLGRMALAEANRPKAAGTITVKGYIRDRQGNPQPVWKVRAGDTISATNFFDGIHLIVETDYSDADKSLRIAVDTPFQLLEALLDRQQNALTARGLT